MLSLFARLAIRAIASLLQMAVLVALARHVSVAEFGSFAAAWAAVNVTSGFSQLGIPTRVLRRPTPGLLLNGYTLSLVGSLAGTGLVIATWILATNDAGSWMVAVGMICTAEATFAVTANWLYGNERLHHGDVFLVLHRTLPAIGLATALILRFDPFCGVASGAAVSALVAACVVAIQGRGPFDLRSTIQDARPYWATNIASTIQQLDVVVIRTTLGPGMAAGYAAAFRLASPVHLVTATLTTTFLPRLSRPNGVQISPNPRATYSRLSLAYTVLVFILSPVAYFVGPGLFGDKYSTYAIVFPILWMASALSVWNQHASNILISLGQAPRAAKLTWAAVTTGLSITAIGGIGGLPLLSIAGTFTGQVVLVGLLAITLRPSKEIQ